MHFFRRFLLALCLLSRCPNAIASDEHLIFRHPAISATQVAFEYANDLWIVSREGGPARRLTNGVGRESDPCFTPDGTQIAFTGQYEGNTDIYVVAAGGGVPRRLTFHPGEDSAVGWTPDGKSVVFNSRRDSFADSGQLYTIRLDRALPEVLPLPMAEDGSYSPDGSHIAYQPSFHWQNAWKRYRGGQSLKIWIASLSDSSIVEVPRESSNDFNPMWSGDVVYFLSDRKGPVSLWSYATTSHKVTEVVGNSGLDFKSASVTKDALVYEQFGALHLVDLKTGTSKPLKVSVDADLPEVRPRFEKAKPSDLANAAVSPTGQRAVFETHGEIFTVPAEKGDIRNITNSVGTAERDPSWSPDGKRIAYFSDESGEYALHIRDQNGLGTVTKVDLGKPASFFYGPTWSPDSKKIAFTDKRLNLWYVDLEKKLPVRIDTDLYDSPSFDMRPKWSPDSEWVAYAKQLHNHLHAISVFAMGTAKSTQITDGLSDAFAPDFDRSGKYIYFLASTNVGLANGWIDMTSIARPTTSAIYAMVLRKDLPSPVAPQSDDENADKKDEESKDKPGKVGEPKNDKGKSDSEAKDKAPPKVTIDFDNISQRIVAIPLPEKNYYAVTPGKEGVIYIQERPIVELNQGPPQVIVNKFDLKTRKTDLIIGGVQTFVLSQDGEKMLYRQADNWFITGAGAAPKPGDGQLKMTDLEVYVDPKAEWRQMYREAWRIERDFFYDPHFHGLDLNQAKDFYSAWSEHLSSRSDLTYLFEEMLGNLNVGHLFVRGGTQPDVPKVKGGLLGADYLIENDRYRFARVYNGENWNPELQAPLTQPGVNVRAGEYLLAVRGQELRASDNIYSFFQQTAGKQIVLRVGPNPDGSNSREVTVVPVDNEASLRHLAWIENNRRKVDQLSGGKLAYVHLPDTANGGFTSFNRYYFAQIGKQGAVIDERYNHGGDIADYIIEYLSRKPMARITTREGEDVSDPTEAIFGPKVMIINQYAGSGGDAMPWYFRKAGLGPLVGMKTWGGLVGIGGYPSLIDGGTVMAPRWAFYGLSGEWEVENHGIAPDIEVEQDPKLVREGHDPQLERAVAAALELLEKSPTQKFVRPPYPDYHPSFPNSAKP